MLPPKDKYSPTLTGLLFLWEKMDNTQHANKIRKTGESGSAFTENLNIVMWLQGPEEGPVSLRSRWHRGAGAGWGSHTENLPTTWRAGLPSLNRGRLGLLRFSLWCKDVSTSLTRTAGCLILAQRPLLAWVPHGPMIPAARLDFTLSGRSGAWPLSLYQRPSLKWGRQHAWNKTSHSNLHMCADWPLTDI